MAAQEPIQQVSVISLDVLPCSTSYPKESVSQVEKDPQAQSLQLDSEDSAALCVRSGSIPSNEESKPQHSSSFESGTISKSENFNVSAEHVDKEPSGRPIESDEQCECEIFSKEISQLQDPPISKKIFPLNEEHYQLDKFDLKRKTQSLSESVSAIRLNDAPENLILKSNSNDSHIVHNIPEIANATVSKPVLCSEVATFDWDSKKRDHNVLDSTQVLAENSKRLSLENGLHYDIERNTRNEDQCKSRSSPHRQSLLKEEDSSLSQRVTRDSAQSMQLASLSSNSDNRGQRKDMYDIKKIKWYDEKSREIAKISPILIQNVNGPCPLLALVNALTLSTPAGLNTPLVETLRSREQVSLGLLLDAVFDEITSGRHGNITNELPDVTDLYSFLVSLQTGMNVNPKFFPAESSYIEESKLKERLWNERKKAGLFEETREMRLYSTFRVSLIHGWLPQPNSPEYAALYRSAKTYEDAQNVILMLEALETKLSHEGLNLEEQILLEDISVIRAFLDSYATQLTPYGLESIRSSICPGNFAILFRNNHFSTLYRHPKTRQLLQLVTDVGYSKNNDVIWESLSDMTGEYAQFYSGDFRLVSDMPAVQMSNQQNYEPDLISQETSQSLTLGRRVDTQSKISQMQKTQQEDHDLAMAIQLQEEEDQRHKTRLDLRRPSTNLSQQQNARSNQTRRKMEIDTNEPINSSTSRIRAKNGPVIPPRRSLLNIRSQPSPQAANLNVMTDHPPPSYEVAATQEAYIPPNIGQMETNSSYYDPNRLPRANHNLLTSETSRRSERRQQIRSQTLNSGSEQRNERRKGPVQGVVDKVISGQGRVQKDCILM
ncbi:putative duf544 domain-containing protein [Erysiphe necator]|uniref:Putative duf544 domain-containing protein n=1 Tax=Uncinula necator TaxID=52586 RepID=A0A0B1NZV9_UNCNE|nr:putative duf544 domain-containing protein [Erysiphe necator]